MIRHSSIFLAWLVLMLCVRPVLADTGQLREVIKTDDLNIVVFTAPTPIRAGVLEVVTLVTDSRSGRPVADYQLDVGVRAPDWTPDVPSMVSMGAPDPGTRFAYKSVVLLPEPGEWALLVEVRVADRAPVLVPITVQAGPPQPLWWQLLPLLLASIPFLGLILARDSILTRSRSRFMGS